MIKYRLYAGRNAEIECFVDEEDYQYFSQWRWTVKKSKRSRKLYFRRSTIVGRRPNHISPTLYLHREIARRMGILNDGEVIDHIDNNSLNNCRENLQALSARANLLKRFIR